MKAERQGAAFKNEETGELSVVAFLPIEVEERIYPDGLCVAIAGRFSCCGRTPAEACEFLLHALGYAAPGARFVGWHDGDGPADVILTPAQVREFVAAGKEPDRGVV